MCGFHILALTRNNELFAWGDNDDGKCGIGSEDDYIPMPTRVHGLETKVKLHISAGKMNSLIQRDAKSARHP